MISATFRRAFDALQVAEPGIRGDAAYLRLLLLAASTLQSEVEAALVLLMDSGALPTADAVKDLIEPRDRIQVPDMPALEVKLEDYDQLLTGTLS